jgi:phage FluMu gp28-like protein
MAINQGGMLTLGSTVYDRNDYFWRLNQDLQKPEKQKLKNVFNLPVFDPNKFNINRPIQEQIKENIKPIVWWLDMDVLERKRMIDQASFLRENMCQPSDESINFLPIQLILKCVDKQLQNFQSYQTNNMLFMGMDVATTHDYAVITIFEKTEFGLVQRYLWYDTNIELAMLETIAKTLIDSWGVSKVRIDMTGMGTDITQRLIRSCGSKVEGVHFGMKLKTLQKGATQGIREKMANNIKMLMLDQKIRLLDDENQTRQLNSWSYDLKNCKDTLQHGDIFWSVGLACLDTGWRMKQPGSMMKLEKDPLVIPPNKMCIDWGK